MDKKEEMKTKVLETIKNYIIRKAAEVPYGEITITLKVQDGLPSKLKMHTTVHYVKDREKINFLKISENQENECESA